MKQRILFILRYYVTLLALFVPARLLFMAVNADKSYPAIDYLNVAWQGLQLDVAIAGYLTALPLLLCIVSIFVKLPIGKIVQPYNVVAAIAIALAFIADASLYPFWGFKLDSTFLLYIDSPENAFASVSIGYLLVRFAMTVAAVTLVSLTLYRITPEKFNPCKGKILTTLTHLFIGGLIFLGIRGGLSESTNNVGRVYFSDEQFLNHSAVNPIFSFLYSLGKMQDFSEAYNYFDEAQRSQLFDSLYTTDSQITDTLLNTTRPNIMTIIFEGMSAVFVEALDGARPVATNLSALCDEGVLFTECYANSFRTDRGLVCLLSGYPSFPQISVMKSPVKSQSLPAIAGSLAAAGYDNTFFYGGDINFTNMKSYLYSGGYNKLYADSDFPLAAQKTHRWGVNDDILFDSLYTLVGRQPHDKPWHITCLTLSSHEPWTVPHNSIPDDEIANAFAYTDSCFGQFIGKLKESPLWDNLLIVCVPDHAVVRYPRGTEQTDRSRNRIPLLLIGGAVKKPGRIGTLCNQTDIAATLLAQLQLPTEEYRFSRNVLSPSYKYPFAYHSYNNGISFIDSTGFSVLDLDSKSILKEEPADSDHKRLDRAKAILQSTYNDYKGR
jgi:phosphoglycerol transferase MdoB-like AlkP superfamily enzyme